jgi:hypothetical protein
VDWFLINTSDTNVNNEKYEFWIKIDGVIQLDDSLKAK